MQHPGNPKRTRCGQPIGEFKTFYPIVHGYGSKYADCKTCQRLHAMDMVKDNCTKCRFSDPDNDYVCSIGHVQIYTTNEGQTGRIGYFAHELSCPDFKLIEGDDQ